MVSAWPEPPSVIPAEWSAEATAVGRCRRHNNQNLGLERCCHTVAHLGLLRLRPGPAHEVFWTWPWEPLAACQSPGLSYSGDRMRGQVFKAIFCRRRHQPRRPPPAEIKPGRPAPAIGPGTGDVMVTERDRLLILR